MPAHSSAGSRGIAPDFVLGDAHGTTCSPRVTQWIEQVLTGFGYQVRRNDPYAGGYVTRHYGRPRDGTHAIQIEIARGLYMNEARFERSPAFATLERHLAALTADLAPRAAALMRG